MRTNHTQRRRILKSGLAMVVLGAVLGITGFVSAPAGAAGNDHQITICHATSSGSNPYTTPHPNKWQIMSPNGHGWDPDDIIPPFPAGSKGNHTWEAYLGLNWDPEGQAIYEQGCNATAPAAGSITLDKVTAGDGQPADTTEFDFSVSCDSGSVDDTTPTIAPDAPATVVATDVEVGDSCTIDETDAAGAVSTTFSVNGGAEQAGPVEVTVESADQVIAVVATNTYECGEGLTPDGEGGCTSTQCRPSTENNQCVPCPTGTPDGQGSCVPASCVPSTDNNQCVPCTSGTPNGQGSCVPARCVPSTDNNQCVPCTSGTPNGQGSCTTDACPGVDGVQASATECLPVVVEGSTVTPTPTPGPTATPAVIQVEGAQLTGTQVAGAQLPRTGTNTRSLVLLGLGLILMGAGALIFGREQTAKV